MDGKAPLYFMDPLAANGLPGLEHQWIGAISNLRFQIRNSNHLDEAGKEYKPRGGAVARSSLARGPS